MYSPDFGKNFFDKHQSKLVSFANSRLGRWFFAIPSFVLPLSVKIDEISPNSITYGAHLVERDGEQMVEMVTGFRTHNRFQKRLEYVYSQMASLLPQAVVASLMRPTSAGFGLALPLLALTTSTFYPNANIETVSVDGTCEENNGDPGLDWSVIIAAAGDAADDSTAGQDYCNKTEHGSGTQQFRRLRRSIFLFDTAALPDTDAISAATLSLFTGPTPYVINDGSSPTLCVVSSAPLTNLAIVAGDFDSLGSTAFSDAPAYTSFSGSVYAVLTLNATGIAAIAKTGVTKFGTKEATYDLTGTAPANSAAGNVHGFLVFFAEQTGTSNDPLLTVTHAVPATGYKNLMLLGVG